MHFQRRKSLRWPWVLIPILIAVLIGGRIAFTRGRPAVTSQYPAPGAVAVNGLAPVQITFTRAMNHASVEAAFTFQPDNAGTFTWEGDTVTFSPSIPWSAGETISVTLGTGARSSLGIPLQDNQTWAFSVARTMLAYLWPADASANMFMLDPVGGEVVQLTEGGGVLEYAVSARGLFIFYSTENGQGGSDLWRLDMLTREAERFLDCGADLCALPQPSRDGEWLAYENISEGSVWVLAREDGKLTRLGDGTRPVWSSDGKLAYYDREGKAFQIVDVSGSLLGTFPNQLGEPGAWSPDGNFFTAPETGTDADSSHLLAFLPINSIINNLSGEDSVEDTSPAYSPDGQWLAFARKYLDTERWTPGRQLWLMAPDGENAHPLTNDEFFSHASFAWSPDSETIAFVRAHRTSPDVPPEIWIIRTDGQNPVRLVIGGYAPQWIP
jgi:Tol biopolymer transport system component